MDYINKIKKVRENIAEWQKEHGNDFSYLLMGIGVGEDPIDDWKYLVSPEEQAEIVKYLERRGFLEITKETKTSFQINVLPKKEPLIRLKTLELISRELKDYYTGYEITKLLEECGVDKKFIVYPTSKWLIFYGLFEELALSQDKKGKELLFKIISESIHPLNLGGDKEKSQKLVEKFNEYLKYNNLEISYVESIMRFRVAEKTEGLSAEQVEIAEERTQEEMQDEFDEMEREELALFQTPEKIEKISILRKNYQTLMNLIEVFCENPSKPTPELNNAYIKLRSNIFQMFSSLGLLDRNLFIYNFATANNKSYNIPFFNLFSAEKDFREKGKKLNWDTIRPEMNAMFGEIDRLYYDVNASDVLSEPDTQTQINDIMLLLTKTKEQNEKTNALKAKASTPEIPIQRIEITAMPELKIKNTENNIIVKNNKKRITLPKFPRTEWSKVTITFLGERDVLLSNNKDTKPSSFVGLGCEDSRNGRPDDSWDFLLRLAQGNGETLPVTKKEREKQKKQKQKITDILRKIFENDTDPFEKEAGGVYKAKFAIKYTAEESSPEKNGKYTDLGEVFAEMTEPSQEDIGSELSQ